MNWLIALTRDVTYIGLIALAAVIVYEIWEKRFVPSRAVSISINIFTWAAALNLALVIVRALL